MVTTTMRVAPLAALLGGLLVAAPALAQSGGDPLPGTIGARTSPVLVGITGFATLPDVEGEPARMMMLVDDPATGRLFVNGMRGPVFTVSADGSTVTEYLDIADDAWGVQVNASGRERGFQSFALHPQFGIPGTPGYGKIYTYTDTDDTTPEPDFAPEEGDAHDTVLLEWTASDPGAATYDGGPPRELIRFQQPFGNHNGGQIGFRPDAEPGEPEFGLLYVGVADGGSGGDPQGLAQDPGSGFGKIFRIDPLGSNSANGEYGIPADNPFVGQPGAVGEVWILGVRNPQRFAWDPWTGMMYVADIGQGTVEELSPAPRGANLGWNEWEGSFRFTGRSSVAVANPRSDPEMTYPVSEYNHGDELILGRAAATGVRVYREGPVPQLQGLILWGDFPSGEIFAIQAEDPPEGGEAAIRRVIFDDGSGPPKSFLEVIRAKNAEQGRSAAGRADLRFGSTSDGRFFLLNKHDGTIRLVTSGG